MKTRSWNPVLAALASVLIGVAILPAVADDAVQYQVKQSIALKDGATAYVFRDGKMAVADRFGRAVGLKAGATLETKDGQRLTLTSNEVARLGGLVREGHQN